MGEYVVHFISIPLSVHDDWEKAERILLRVAEAECKPFAEEARKHMASLEKRYWIDTPAVEPRTSVYCHDGQSIKLMLRISTPLRKKGRIEQTIIRQFLKEFTFGAPSRVQQGAVGTG